MSVQQTLINPDWCMGLDKACKSQTKSHQLIFNHVKPRLISHTKQFSCSTSQIDIHTSTAAKTPRFQLILTDWLTLDAAFPLLFLLHRCCTYLSHHGSESFQSQLQGENLSRLSKTETLQKEAMSTPGNIILRGCVCLQVTLQGNSVFRVIQGLK